MVYVPPCRVLSPPIHGGPFFCPFFPGMLTAHDHAGAVACTDRTKQSNGELPGHRCRQRAPGCRSSTSSPVRRVWPLAGSLARCTHHLSPDGLLGLWHGSLTLPALAVVAPLQKKGTYHYKVDLKALTAVAYGDMAEGMPECSGSTIAELEKAMYDVRATPPRCGPWLLTRAGREAAWRVRTLQRPSSAPSVCRGNGSTHTSYRSLPRHPRRRAKRPRSLPLSSRTTAPGSPRPRVCSPLALAPPYRRDICGGRWRRREGSEGARTRARACGGGDGL